MKQESLNIEVIRKMDQTLSQYLFTQKEENFVHATLNEEMSSFHLVTQGDIKALKRFLVKHRNRTFSKLSDSPLQQQKYLFVSVITTCCRFCIEAGMASDESYGLSDLYIRKMDKCTTVDEVKDMYETMMLDYAMRMKSQKMKEQYYSPKTLACMEYIENHLHDRITVNSIAYELDMNASWLSTTFSKEVGMSISEYIRSKKIAAAKYLLTTNEYSCTDIAEYLGFSTESHFSALFTKHEGISPKEYRKKYFRKHFSRFIK
ncbi:MAG: helix-turn-helix domain-containing protein [Oribacterium sp.]|nr:helix-turn-helix domain-containing protein [Oribacterium sp.]